MKFPLIMRQEAEAMHNTHESQPGGGGGSDRSRSITRKDFWKNSEKIISDIVGEFVWETDKNRILERHEFNPRPKMEQDKTTMYKVAYAIQPRPSADDDDTKRGNEPVLLEKLSLAVLLAFGKHCCGIPNMGSATKFQIRRAIFFKKNYHGICGNSIINSCLNFCDSDVTVEVKADDNTLTVTDVRRCDSNLDHSPTVADTAQLPVFANTLHDVESEDTQTNLKELESEFHAYVADWSKAPDQMKPFILSSMEYYKNQIEKARSRNIRRYCDINGSQEFSASVKPKKIPTNGGNVQMLQRRSIFQDTAHALMNSDDDSVEIIEFP